MIRVLRQLNTEEMRMVTYHSRARAGATPEEIIRALSRQTGVVMWGIFPSSAPDVLLDNAGRRLGLEPMVGGPHALAMRERAILGSYLRLAWSAAEDSHRDALLRAAVAAWDHPSLPPPPYQRDAGDGYSADAALEWLLQQSAGCRALAAATEKRPLPLPPLEGSLLGGLRVPGLTRTGGHEALYEVLLILWRARARMLRDRRGQRGQLARQERQLGSLVAVRRRDLETAPVGWEQNPVSGLAVAAAAATAMTLHMVIPATTPLPMIVSSLVGMTGLVWSAGVFTFRPRPAADRRLTRMSTQIDTTRTQLAQLEREIRVLESE
jgi:hypothetical protein